MLKIEPHHPRTGVPITVSSTEGAFLQVVPVNKANGEPFQVNWKQGKRSINYAEFALMIPGEYELKAGSLTETIKVELQRDLSFFIEFGLLSALVLFFLMGILLWTQKKKSSV